MHLELHCLTNHSSPSSSSSQEIHVPLHVNSLQHIAKCTQLTSLQLFHRDYAPISPLSDLCSLSSLTNLNSLSFNLGKHYYFHNIEDQSYFISSLTKLTNLSFIGIDTAFSVPCHINRLSNLKTLTLITNCANAYPYATVTIPTCILRLPQLQLTIGLQSDCLDDSSHVDAYINTNAGVFLQTHYKTIGVISSCTIHSPILEHANSWTFKNLKCVFFD